jgi:aspartyl-tRNA synthetase
MGAETPATCCSSLSGETEKTRKQLSELRLEMGRRLGLMNPGVFKPLWVLDFPLLEWDEDSSASSPCTTRSPRPKATMSPK